MNVPVLLFAIGGLLTSWYIYYKKRRHERLTCLISRDCDKVVRSRYNALLFGIPNETLGMAYFGLVGITSIAMLLGLSSIGFLSLASTLTVVGGVAAAFSVVLIYIQAQVIKKWCDYCLISAVFSVVIVVIELMSVLPL